MSGTKSAGKLYLFHKFAANSYPSADSVHKGQYLLNFLHWISCW